MSASRAPPPTPADAALRRGGRGRARRGGVLAAVAPRATPAGSRPRRRRRRPRRRCASRVPPPAPSARDPLGAGAPRRSRARRSVAGAAGRRAARRRDARGDGEHRPRCSRAEPRRRAVGARSACPCCRTARRAGCRARRSAATARPHAPRRRPRRLHRDALPRRPRRLPARVGVGSRAGRRPPGASTCATGSRAIASPAYGPVAFGTSARSADLTDWPAGGFIGIHGTDQPGARPRPRLARLHPAAQRATSCAWPRLHAGRHAGHDPLSRGGRPPGLAGLSSDDARAASQGGSGCRVCAARPGRRAGRARAHRRRRPRAPRRAARDAEHAVLPVPARRREGARRRSRSRVLAWRLVRAHSTAAAGERLLVGARAAAVRRLPRLRLSLSPRLWLASFARDLALVPVQSDAGAVSAGRWPLLAPWLHTYALPVFAVLSVLVAIGWGAVRDWLADVEGYAAATFARAFRLLRARAAARAPRRGRRRARAAPPLRARVRVAPASAPRLTRGGPLTPRVAVVDPT